jgi:hypothetical protein
VSYRSGGEHRTYGDVYVEVIGFSLIIRSSAGVRTGHLKAVCGFQGGPRGRGLHRSMLGPPQRLGATRGHGNTAQGQRPFVLSPAFLEFRRWFQIPRRGIDFPSEVSNGLL